MTLGACDRAAIRRTDHGKKAVAVLTGEGFGVDRGVRWAIKRYLNLRAGVMKKRCRAVNRWRSRRRLEAWTGEPRI